MAQARPAGGQWPSRSDAPASLRDLWRHWRNRKIADPAFQRWAAAFPPTRPIAHAHTRATFDLVAGFVYSQILVACVRLQLFGMLERGPRPLAELADGMSLGEPAAETLLKAACALKLVEKTGQGMFALGPLGAVIGASPAIVAMIEHHTLLYGDLADPVALLRGEARDLKLKGFWGYPADANVDAALAAPYSRLMAQSQSLIAQEILAAYPLKRHRSLIDVGGGEGAFCIAAADQNPALFVRVFDLPSVAARAAANLERAKLGGRSGVTGGSFIEGPLPRGADIMSLVRVLHDHDDVTVAIILRNIRDALPEGGRILIAEPMSGTHGALPMGDGYFGFYLFAMGSGRPRTLAEYEGFLTRAGFRVIRRLRSRQPLLIQAIVAAV